MEINEQFSPMDFEFLIIISDLIITVRRTLCYSYAMRYYLTGKNRQALFDFMQGQLETSLERLTKIVEGQNLLDYLEINFNGLPHMGEKFFNFKTRVVDLERIVEG